MYGVVTARHASVIGIVLVAILHFTAACQGHGDACSVDADCCLHNNTVCDQDIMKCRCGPGFSWSIDTDTCFESLSNVHIFIIVTVTIGFSIAVYVVVALLAPRCKRYLAGVRASREARELPTVSDVPDSSFSPPQLPHAPPGPLSLRELLLQARLMGDEPLPPPTPPVVISDEPPNYDDLSPTPISPPPDYIKATEHGGFIFPDVADHTTSPADDIR